MGIMRKILVGSMAAGAAGIILNSNPAAKTAVTRKLRKTAKVVRKHAPPARRKKAA